MLTFAQARNCPFAPKEIIALQSVIAVPYVDVFGEEQMGQLVIHRDLAAEVGGIFGRLYARRFPIGRIVPIVRFNGDDLLSMAANNTSGFCYRNILGTGRLSMHATGRAIDLNPAYNPYTVRSGNTYPPGAEYDPSRPGTITQEIADEFRSRGWVWGGDWERKDWHHFEKPE